MSRDSSCPIPSSPFAGGVPESSVESVIGSVTESVVDVATFAAGCPNVRDVLSAALFMTSSDGRPACHLVVVRSDVL